MLYSTWCHQIIGPTQHVDSHHQSFELLNKILQEIRNFLENPNCSVSLHLGSQLRHKIISSLLPKDFLRGASLLSCVKNCSNYPFHTAHVQMQQDNGLSTAKSDHTHTVSQGLLQAGIRYCTDYTATAVHVTLKHRREKSWNLVLLVYQDDRTTCHPPTTLCSSDCIDQ